MFGITIKENHTIVLSWRMRKVVKMETQNHLNEMIAVL